MATEMENAAVTLRAEARIELRGWHNEDHEEARLFGERLMALTQEYSRWLDLSRLTRVVLALDYHTALAEFRDEDDAPLGIATSNEFGQGSAMSLVVANEGALESVVVIWTPLISRIFDEDDSHEKRTALQSYVHELVHVDDQAFLDQTFPGGGAAAVQRDNRDGALLAMVMPAHAEYSPTRRTACIEPETGFEFVDLLEKTIAQAIADVRRERRRYRVYEIGLEVFWPYVHERGRFIFQALGYALGHVDGVLHSEQIEASVKERLRVALDRIEAMELGWLVEETRSAVHPIFEQPAWTDLEVFDPLIAVGERLLNSFGIWTRLEDSQLYVDVPLTGLADF